MFPAFLLCCRKHRKQISCSGRRTGLMYASWRGNEALHLQFVSQLPRHLMHLCHNFSALQRLKKYNPLVVLRLCYLISAIVVTADDKPFVAELNWQRHGRPPSALALVLYPLEKDRDVHRIHECLHSSHTGQSFRKQHSYL